jgi:hypothetical protein
MAANLTNYNPMYMTPPPERGSKYVITNTEWNNLWTLITMQTNNTSENLKALLDKFTLELWGTDAATFLSNAEIAPGAGITVASQLAWLKAQVDSANAKSTAAVNTANSANTKATNAVNTANNADINASLAVGTADAAKTTADAAKTTADTVKADYDILKPQMVQAVEDANAASAAVADKVDKAYVDQTARNFTMGIVSPGSVLDSMLSADPTQIKQRVAVITNTVKTLEDNTMFVTDEIPSDPLPRDADYLGGHPVEYFAPQGTLNEHKADYATFKEDTEADITAIEVKLTDYNSYASAVDSNGVYTVVDYKRPDGTLYMKSTLSGGTSPKYTTDTWKFYDALGTTIIATKIWTMTYDANDKITSKVVA